MHHDVDDGLFADPRPVQATPAISDPDAIADWQVAALRKALDGLGSQSMAARQNVIEDLAGRPVASLRELTSTEALAIYEQLPTRKKPRGASGSSWDERDEDTWIDRM